MKITGSWLKPNKRLNPTQLNYVEQRLENIVQDLNVQEDIYGIHVGEYQIHESKDITIPVTKEGQEIGRIVIKNGEHKDKMVEQKLDDMVKLTFDIGLYKDFTELKYDVHGLFLKHFIL